MALGGGGMPQPPAAQPQTPVPQEDDPKSLETKRTAAIANKNRDGYSAHLLSAGGTDGVDPMGGASKKLSAGMME